MISADFDITKQDFLLFDRYFRRGETCSIIGEPGSGKTFMACYIAKNPSIKKCIYFELDDGEYQKERLRCVPSIYPIYLDEFTQTLEKMKREANGKFWERAIKDTVYKFPAQIEAKRQKYLRQHGLNDTVKIDKLLLFEIYTKEAIANGADLIILDCLHYLVANPCEITRFLIERISKLCRKQHISFLIIHHPNKKGDYLGSIGIKEVVDTMLCLKKLDGNLIEITIPKGKFTPNAQACIVEMISEGDHSVCFKIREENILHQLKEYSPLEKKIIESLRDKDSITFEELWRIVGSPNENSLKTYLKNLEKDRCLKRPDGTKSWKVILNCHKDTAA